MLRKLPWPQGYHDWAEVDLDHYLEDLLFVEEDWEWLECCAPLLAEYFRLEGFVVSKKSVLNPVTCFDWLGKVIDLEQLSMSNPRFLKNPPFCCPIANPR